MLDIGIRTDFVDLPEVARLGYGYVELPLSALSVLPESDFTELKAYIEACGIRVYSVCDLLPEDLPVTGQGVNATALHGYLHQALGRAHLLGAKVAVLDAPASRRVGAEEVYPFAWRQLGNFLRLAQGHARDWDIVIAVEPVRTSDRGLLNLVSEATLITGLLQLSHIAVCAHWGQMSMASEPMGTLRRTGALLRHVRVENALTRTLPRAGDGEDYTRLTSVLEDMGYAGGITLCGEITDRFPREAGEALSCMQTILQRGAL